ncbi:MAG TPA: hypothetical protein VF039_12645 [Longimicrobiales bacterium]
MRLRRSALLVLAVLASACTAATNGTAEEQAAVDTLVYTGVVQQSGSSIERSVVLEQQGGQPVRLGGELVGELERLSGGTVRVEGVWTGLNGGSLDVARYELLRISGGVPVVGVLEDRAGTLWLRGASSVQLVAPPADLRDHVGARIWLLGEADEAGFRAHSYGVIADR